MSRFIALSFTLALAGLAPAADAYPRKGRTNHEHCGDRFGSGKKVELAGKVAEVARVNWERGAEGLHLQLRTGDDLTAVHAGPARWAAEQGLEIKEGDELKVTGVRVQCNGSAVVLPTSITKGGKTVPIRDDKGKPLWTSKAKR